MVSNLELLCTVEMAIISSNKREYDKVLSLELMEFKFPKKYIMMHYDRY